MCLDSWLFLLQRVEHKDRSRGNYPNHAHPILLSTRAVVRGVAAAELFSKSSAPPETMAVGKKQLVDWSCSGCTSGAKFPQRGPNANKTGHLNYAKDKHCRKCKEPKGECHLCAYSDLGPKLKAAQNSGAPQVQHKLAYSSQREERKGS